eukprot:6464617-Amphidinium_carterae.1
MPNLLIGSARPASLSRFRLSRKRLTDLDRLLHNQILFIKTCTHNTQRSVRAFKLLSSEMTTWAAKRRLAGYSAHC